MATAILVNELEKDAVELIKALDKKGFVFTVAALMKKEDDDDWRLVLAVPEIRIKGMRGALTEINNIIMAENLGITLQDVRLVDDKDRLFNLLRNNVSNNLEMSRVVVTGNFFEGTRFPDSIIYVVR